MRITLLAAVLVLAAAPAAGGEVYEFLFDTSRTFVPTPGYQRMPSVAFDGTNYLVVWGDWRDVDYEVYATRIAPDGTMLDQGGIVVSSGAGGREEPVVAFDGTNYLVAWLDERAGGDDIAVYCARVSPAGVVLDTSGVAVCTTAGWRYELDAAVLGDRVLLVWSDERNGGSGYQDVYGARIDRNGQVLDPDGFAVCRRPDEQFSPSVAAHGANWLVVWRHDFPVGVDTTVVEGTRVSAAGVVLDTSGIRISPGDYGVQPAVSFDGTNALVVFLTNNDSIRAVRMAQSGQVLDPNGRTLGGGGDVVDLDVEHGGVDYLVAWVTQPLTMRALRVAPDGTVRDPGGFVVSSAGGELDCPAVAAGSGGWLVAWEDERLTGVWPDVYCARVTAAGTVLDPNGRAASVTANDQRRPAASFDGRCYLAVWEDARLGGDSLALVFGRIMQGGRVLTPSGVMLSRTAGSSLGYAWPAAAFDGTNHVVAWCDYRAGRDRPDVYCARIDRDGAVLDPSGIAVSDRTSTNDVGEPAVACGTANSLVAWTDRRASTAHIYAARVSPGGAVLDTAGIAVSRGSRGEYAPAVAFGAGVYLVAWQHNGSGGAVDIRAARVSGDGAVLDSTTIVVSAAADDQLEPAVTFDGANFVVAWTDRRTSRLEPDVYCARVSPSGVVLDPSGVAVATGAGTQQQVAAARTGAGSVLAWTDNRSGGYDIRAAWLDGAGAVTDTASVVTQDGNQSWPALAQGAGAEFLFTWEGWTGTVDGKAYRTARTWGRLWPVPGVVELNGGAAAPWLRAYPNPCAYGTAIRFSVTARSAASIGVHDVSGRLVRTLPAQCGRAEWDGRAESGALLPPGVYFARCAGAGQVRLVLAGR